jgi:hypothetical protein
MREGRNSAAKTLKPVFTIFTPKSKTSNQALKSKLNHQTPSNNFQKYKYIKKSSKNHDP